MSSNFDKQGEAAAELMSHLREQERLFAARMRAQGYERHEIHGSITYTMTQRRQAEQILEKLRLLPEDDRRKLREVSAAAQNGPPHGEADGSINEQAWNALREIEAAHKAIVRAIDIFKSSLS